MEIELQDFHNELTKMKINYNQMVATSSISWEYTTKLNSKINQLED